MMMLRSLAIHSRSIVALLCVVAGIVGAAALAPLLYSPVFVGPPPASGIVLSLLVAAFGGEALWWTLRCGRGCAPPARGSGGRCCRLACTFMTDAAAVVIAVGFAVGYRLDLFAWSLALGAALAIITAEALAHSRAEASAAAAAAVGVGINDGSVGKLSAYVELRGGEGAAPARCAALRACACAPPGSPAWRRCLFATHAVAWALASAALVLCAVGAATVGAGWRRFPPRGALYRVPAGGAMVSMHAWCTGPPPSALPTIFLDIGGGGHSSSDAYGFADALAEAGRRICAADPPGCGWSPLGGADASQLISTPVDGSWSLQLLATMGEPGPFVLVGTMDGGAPRVYEAALAAPAAVAAVIPMQYGVSEFANLAAYRGWSAAVARQQASAVLAARLVFCDAIRFLGTTWGLVGLFAGSEPPGYTPAGRWPEKNVLNLEHEGQWDLQCRMLAAQVRDPDSIFAPDIWENRTLAGTVRVLAIDNPPADPCAFSTSTDDCALQRFTTAQNSQFMRNMTTMTSGSKYLAYNGSKTGWLGDGASDLAWLTAQIISFLEAA